MWPSHHTLSMTSSLRSGNYEQGTQFLRSGTEYCCLGVLCDLYIKENGGLKWERVEDCDIDVLVGEDQPQIVVSWAGLPEPSPDIVVDGNTDCIAAYNDNGAPFSVIADLIEAQL